MILEYGTIIITDYLDKGGKHKGEEHNFVLIFVVWLQLQLDIITQYALSPGDTMIIFYGRKKR